MKNLVIFSIFLSACGVQNESAISISRRSSQIATQAQLDVQLLNDELRKLRTRQETLERLMNTTLEEKVLLQKELDNLKSQVASIHYMQSSDDKPIKKTPATPEHDPKELD